jgi:hypothetical protein
MGGGGGGGGGKAPSAQQTPVQAAEPKATAAKADAANREPGTDAENNAQRRASGLDRDPKTVLTGNLGTNEQTNIVKPKTILGV